LWEGFVVRSDSVVVAAAVVVVVVVGVAVQHMDCKDFAAVAVGSKDYLDTVAFVVGSFVAVHMDLAVGNYYTDRVAVESFVAGCIGPYRGTVQVV